MVCVLSFTPFRVYKMKTNFDKKMQKAALLDLTQCNACTQRRGMSDSLSGPFRPLTQWLTDGLTDG